MSEEHDLDDKVVQAVAEAAHGDEPITYATGPMADRRVSQAMRRYGVKAPKDRLCASINRLVERGIIDRIDTGRTLTAAGSCITREYPIVQLTGG